MEKLEETPYGSLEDYLQQLRAMGVACDQIAMEAAKYQNKMPESLYYNAPYLRSWKSRWHRIKGKVKEIGLLLYYILMTLIMFTPLALLGIAIITMIIVCLTAGPLPSSDREYPLSLWYY